MLRAIPARERQDRARRRFPSIASVSPGTQRSRTQQLGPTDPRTPYQRERVDRRRLTPESSDRVGALGVTVGEPPLPGRDQREREQGQALLPVVQQRGQLAFELRRRAPPIALGPAKPRA